MSDHLSNHDTLPCRQFFKEDKRVMRSVKVTVPLVYMKHG